MRLSPPVNAARRVLWSARRHAAAHFKMVDGQVRTRPRFKARAPTASVQWRAHRLRSPRGRSPRMPPRQYRQRPSCGSVSGFLWHLEWIVQPLELVPGQSARRSWCTLVRQGSFDGVPKRSEPLVMRARSAAQSELTSLRVGARLRREGNVREMWIVISRPEGHPHRPTARRGQPVNSPPGSQHLGTRLPRSDMPHGVLGPLRSVTAAQRLRVDGPSLTVSCTPWLG